LFLHNRRRPPRRVFVLAQVEVGSRKRPMVRMAASELRPESSVVAEVRPLPNHNERKRKGNGTPDMIVLHYTGMPDDQDAIRRLCSPTSEVSAHYLVLPDGYITNTHHVTIVDDGSSGGHTYRSLSSIARAITGTKWYGYAFSACARAMSSHATASPAEMGSPKRQATRRDQMVEFSVSGDDYRRPTRAG
jgi:hypothetical protein